MDVLRLAWAASAATVFGLAALAIPPVPLGMSVTPKSEAVLAEEARDPVASQCAKDADVLATEVKGRVGDVVITHDEIDGTVWSGALLVTAEPPVAPPLRCTLSGFDVGPRIRFTPGQPPSAFPWALYWGNVVKR